MPIYPGLRVFPAQLFSEWVNPEYWETVAGDVAQIAALRPEGEPRIGLDGENYKSGSEPTLAMLTAAGYTLQQFRAAIQPLMDLLYTAKAVVCVYPQVLATTPNDVNQFIVALLDTLGPGGVEVWWEDSFNISEAHRRSRSLSWAPMVAQMHINEADFERHVGVMGLRHRHVIDDDLLRTWGSQAASAIGFMGTIRPWIFDLTRRDLAQWGTPAAVTGVSMSTANDVQYAWSWNPVATHQVYSVGLAPSLAMMGYRGDALSMGPGNCAVLDIAGVRLTPPPGYTVASVRASAMPTGGAANTWFLDFTFQIPPEINVDVPVISQAQYNFGLWQIYYAAGSNSLVLQIAPSGQPTQRFEMKSALLRDTDIRLQFGRNGGSQWVFSVDGGPVTRVSVPGSVGSHYLLSVGAGLVPATFPAQKTQLGCPGILLREQLCVWHRCPGDAEIVSEIQAGRYPWRRGT